MQVSQYFYYRKIAQKTRLKISIESYLDEFMWIIILLIYLMFIYIC